MGVFFSDKKFTKILDYCEKSSCVQVLQLDVANCDHVKSTCFELHPSHRHNGITSLQLVSNSFGWIKT